MGEETGRLVRPPVEPVISGRIFRPALALLYKKFLKLVLLAITAWLVLVLTHIYVPLLYEIIAKQTRGIVNLIGLSWESLSLLYWELVIPLLIVGIGLAYILYRGIRYSVTGWDGASMPDLFSRKGVINITEKSIPFRTITNIAVRKGIFDRLFNLGTVRIETAGGSKGVQATGLITLVLQFLFRKSGEIRIEGIYFANELGQFILRELRGFGAEGLEIPTERRWKRKGGFFTPDTLEAFRQIRNVLEEQIAY